MSEAAAAVAEAPPTAWKESWSAKNVEDLEAQIATWNLRASQPGQIVQMRLAARTAVSMARARSLEAFLVEASGDGKPRGAWSIAKRMTPKPVPAARSQRRR